MIVIIIIIILISFQNGAKQLEYVCAHDVTE